MTHETMFSDTGKGILGDSSRYGRIGESNRNQYPVSGHTVPYVVFSIGS